MELKWKFIPNESQEPFFASTRKFLLANGGYGSGKSSMIANKALAMTLIYPGTMGLIGRRTYPELRDTTRRVFFEWCAKDLIKKWNKTENHLVFINNSEILFRALDDTFKVGSLELGWFAIDELSEFPTSDEFDALRGRLRHPKGPGMGFAATNPATREHWLYKVFVERQDPDFDYFEIDTYSNKEHLPEGYIKDLEKFPPEWQERYLKGKWGIVPKGTRVFGKFTPSLHLGEFKFNPYLAILRGWDFGFRHPAVMFAQETDMGRIIFLREILGDEIYIDDFSDYVIRKSNEWFPNMNFIDFCDISGGQRDDRSKFTSIQLLRNKGIDPTYRKTMDLDHDLELFNNLFEKMIGNLPRVCVNHRGCPIFSDALAGGYYRDKNGLPTGDDYFDHLVDAARYIVTNLLGFSRRKIAPVLRTSYPTLSEARG